MTAPATSRAQSASGSLDLRREAARLESEWARVAATRALPSRFLYDDETVLLPLPPTEGHSCMTIAFIGPRGLSFHVKLPDVPEDPLAAEPAVVSSGAGLLEVVHCERGRPLRRVQITSDAGRGTIETRIALSDAPIVSARDVLLERTVGEAVARSDGHAPAPLAPIERRAEAAEARARWEGGTIGPRVQQRAGADGTGEVLVRLTPGCHRLEVLAAEGPQTRRGRKHDVDAELRDDDDVLLARDRSEAEAAHLEACVAEETSGTIAFTGAPSGVPMLVVAARWALPGTLPREFGPDGEARMARALRSRSVPLPPGRPVQVVHGAAGSAMVPVPVEPGGCYTALATVVHGHARSIGLRTRVGAREFFDQRAGSDEAALTSFCVQGATNAQVDVEARGSGVVWAVAVYRMTSRIWETSR